MDTQEIIMLNEVENNYTHINQIIYAYGCRDIKYESYFVYAIDSDGNDYTIHKCREKDISGWTLSRTSTFFWRVLFSNWNTMSLFEIEDCIGIAASPRIILNRPLYFI